MSSTFSDLAATSVLRALADAPASGRHLVPTVLGGDVAAVFRAVLARSETSRELAIGSQAPLGLRVVETGYNSVVVPYLVIEPPPAEPWPNRGGQGFIGAIRDRFEELGRPDERVQLLTFDSQPNETELTTMDQGVVAASLEATRILTIALETPPHAGPFRRLLQVLRAMKLGEASELSPETIGETALAVAELSELQEAQAIGDHLYQLPWLLRDPELFEHHGHDLEKRLQAAMTCRATLEALAADPNTDFDAAVRTSYAGPVAERLSAARQGPVIDWSGLAFGELVAATPRPADATPRFAPRAIEVREAELLKKLPSGVLTASIPGPSATLTLHLSAPLVGGATIHLDGFVGQKPPFTRTSLWRGSAADLPNPSSAVVPLTDLPQARVGWSFLEIFITRGRRPGNTTRLDERILVLRIDPADQVLVYETSGEVDLELQAFSGSDDLVVVGESEGQEWFVETVEADVDPEMVTVGGSWRLPVVQIQAPDPDEPDQPSTESPLHLALESWARGELAPGDPSLHLRRRPDGTVVADAGVIQMPIRRHHTLPGSRWDLERQIIERPTDTSFLLSADGQLRADGEIQGRALGALEQPFRRFAQARIDFFGQLAELPVPSILAEHLTDSEAAERYVAAYRDLVNVVPNGQAGELGYDRIVLVDAVRVEATGETLFAPTHPLTVAFHTGFERMVRDCLSVEPTSNYFLGDADAVTPRALVPFLRLQSGGPEWLESGYAPYPWRRYVPLSLNAALERPPAASAYIAARILRFLDVHPNYRSRRRVLRLAFINPGQATHIRDALLQLFTPVPRRRVHGDLPSFELQLLADDDGPDSDVMGSALDLFMSARPEGGQLEEAALQVMARLSYTKGAAREFLTDPKAFAHMTFVENFFRPQPDLVEWEGSAHPSSYYAAGLASETERLARPEPSGIRFLTSTWGGDSAGTGFAALAARVTEVAASAAGTPVKVGVTRAADVRVPDSLLPALYDRSVWVVHIDRHIGLELFYRHQSGMQGPYILDYTDQETADPGIYDGITATRQIAPYHSRIGAVLGPVMQEELTREATARLLDTMNRISGRWGIELLQTDEAIVRARLATVLTAEVLSEVAQQHPESDGITIVVALDELLRASPGEGLVVGDGWLAKLGWRGSSSDDLLFLTIPTSFAGRPRLVGRIVEVKFRSNIGASPNEAAAQLRSTYEALQAIFGCEAQPGRAFQGRRLARLILRYAARHNAALGSAVMDPAAQALSKVAAGEYDLELGVPHGGESLIGDYVSVEPNLVESSLQRSVYETPDGVRIGRVRIGAPEIRKLLAGPPDQGGAEPNRTTKPRPDTLGPRTANPGSGLPAPTGTDEARLEQRDHGGAREPAADTAAGPRHRAGAAPPLEEGQSARPFDVDPEIIKETASRLDDVLASFRLPLQPVEPANAVCGPNVIRFRIRMARGGTIAQLEARERDIMRELGLDRPVMIDQSGGFVTVDLPRQNPVPVHFGAIAAHLPVGANRGQLPVLFGVDVAGAPRVENLAALPHLLVAGTTGAGKSVFLSSVIASLSRLPPSSVEIVLVDVKGLDFAPYRALPHLRRPPVAEAGEALDLLEELYETERSRRGTELSAAGAQSILDYYDRLDGQDLRQIVVIIDEFSNLLGGDKATGSRLEDVVQKYAEIMRSFGIYLVIATQRPSADIVTGRIKANLPARCAFRLPTHTDSVTILGRKGAEQLLGKGDMLFYRDGAVERIQAPLTSPGDVMEVEGRG